MSFTHEEGTTTAAAPEQVWALWSDVGTWAAWDPAVEHVVLEGDFVSGAGGSLTLSGGIEAAFTLEVVVPGERYLDVLTMGDLSIRIDHRVQAVPGGAEIRVHTVIEGPGAADIGPIVVADAPVALAALVELAERRGSG